MTNSHENQNSQAAAVVADWTTRLAQLQLEGLMQVDRQLHRLTSIQRDIERLRVMHLEGDNALTGPETRRVWQMLDSSVKALVEEAKSAPETFVEMHKYVGTLIRIAESGDREHHGPTTPRTQGASSS